MQYPVLFIENMKVHLQFEYIGNYWGKTSTIVLDRL